MTLSAIKTIDPAPWMTAPATAAVMAALADGGPKPGTLFVGGCVRNTLLGLSPGDIDIATVWTPPQVIERLERAGLRALPTGIDHGTITALAQGQTFEITTLRRDVETDGRRAVVAFTTDWREDAQRRDFTMNTLLADAEGRIYDPIGQGLADLAARRVVFVGDADQRIAEDALRILRFFRFHAFYGQGLPDAAALAACRAGTAKITTLSRERITQEFMRILGLADPISTLQLMFENNVLSGLPHKKYDPALLSRLCGLQNSSCHPERSEGSPSGSHKSGGSLTAFGMTTGRLAVLAGFDVGYRAILEKYLIFSNAQKKEFDAILKVFSMLEDLSEKTLKTLIYQFNNDIVIQSVLLFLAAHNTTDTALLPLIKDWQAPAFPLSGADVKNLGIPDGPATGQLLKAAEQWWLDSHFQPDRAACLQALKDLATTRS